MTGARAGGAAAAAAAAAAPACHSRQQLLLLVLVLVLLPALACDEVRGYVPGNASLEVPGARPFGFIPSEYGLNFQEGVSHRDDGPIRAETEEGAGNAHRSRIGCMQRGEDRGEEDRKEGRSESDGGREGSRTRVGSMQREANEGEEDGREARNDSERGREGRTARAVGDEYIVRFREYRHASAHREALERALGSSEGWLWVDRHNPAARFPTDFGLLRIQDGRRESLLSRLGGIAFVRDVSPQMQFTRQLASDSRPEAGPGSVAGENKFSKEEDGSSGGFGPFQEKDPGRLRTAMSFGDEVLNKWYATNSSEDFGGRGALAMERSQITSMFEAEKLWAKGYTGAKVKMAVFDTGIRGDHPHFRNIKERTNWTNEKDILNDNLGHGTFVAGVISSQDPQCLGFAPDAEVYAFRVFTDAQVSYTSWFLDAFNYAIATKMNVLNLSIGGPDYLDSPFVEKVWEMTANNIIMVSAIGNDGPLYGTLNNPADQSDVIGVGGIDYSNHIASFSSRGMSTWELPHGYGRVKPDIVAYGREVIGSKITTGCKSLSGTSVASPVVAGGVCLLASVVPEKNRWDILNPASMKQALIEGATQLAGPNMFEQGAGRLNLLNSFQILRNYTPRASIHPSVLDLTDCPYTWPFCRQPLYHGAMPVIFNATILNGMGVVGYVEAPPVWTPFSSVGHLLDIQFTYSDVIWPWTGHVGLHFRIKPEGSAFTGTIEGNVTFTVVSPPERGEQSFRRWDCHLPIKVAVVPTPPREKRILWDQFHSIRYPPGYIPRDSLDVRNDILDWHGDHMHTNFHGMFDSLRDAGFFLETLGSPLTCFDALQYGTLLMVDLEDEYHEEEIRKLGDDVKQHGLGLIVFADWYHLETMVKMRFFDDNTRSWWTPATGGANVPALNDLLSPFGIAFGDTILNGAYSIGTERAHYASGTDIRKFPTGGFVHSFLFQDSTGGNAGITSTRTGVRAQVESPILGVLESGKGRIAVYGDSNCLDNSHMVTNCYWLLKRLLDFTSSKIRDPLIFASTNELLAPVGGRDSELPIRRSDVNFSTYSLVLDRELRCGIDAPREVQSSSGYLTQRKGSVNPYPNSAPLLSSMTQRQSMTSDLAGDKEPPMSPLLGSSLIGDHRATDRTDGANGLSQYSLDDPKGGEEYLEINGSERVSIRRNSGGMSNNGNVGKDSADLRESDGIMDLLGGWKMTKESRLSVGRQRGEMDSAGLVFQWLVPVSLCATGFFLFWSLWTVRQKRPRRAKKGSKSMLLTV